MGEKKVELCVERVDLEASTSISLLSLYKYFLLTLKNLNERMCFPFVQLRSRDMRKERTKIQASTPM